MAMARVEVRLVGLGTEETAAAIAHIKANRRHAETGTGVKRGQVGQGAQVEYSARYLHISELTGRETKCFISKTGHICVWVCNDCLEKGRLHLSPGKLENVWDYHFGGVRPSCKTAKGSGPLEERRLRGINDLIHVKKIK